MCSRAKAGFRLMPLTDAFEITRAAVSNCRIFAIFATLDPLKLQCGRSYFPLFSNLRAITLRLYEKRPSVPADTPNAARPFVPSPAVSFSGGFRTPAS
jgi:hypothetical protein